jgi:hypothetical protein
MKRAPFTFLMIALLALMPALHTATAQENVPQVAPPQDRPVGVLAEFEVAELPTPHAEVWFVRMQLAPDGSLPESPQIGPVVVYVEIGELTLETDVAIDVAPDSEAPAVATPDAAFQTVLKTGESAMIPAGAMLQATNMSAEPVTFLVVMMYAAELEGSVGDTGEPVGLTQSLLSAGGVEFPPIPGKVTIERVEIPAEEPTTGMQMAGIELGMVEEGRAAVTFMAFDTGTMIWPGMQEANGETVYADNVRVPMTGSAQLDAGDGYVTTGTATMWIPMGDPVVVLRVIAGPDMMP